MNSNFSRFNLLPSWFLGTAAVAAIAIYQPAAIATKSPQEIAQFANLVTVQVNASVAGRGSGTGVIIAKQGNSYIVLTANHVQADAGENATIGTYDGRSYPIDRFQSLGSLENDREPDLAVLTFTSTSDYQTATLGDSDRVAVGSQIFVFGYPAQGIGANRQTGANRDSEFSPGFVTSRRSNAQYGYTLRYNAVTLGGMSGGPVFDVDGRVVGIHGLGDQDEKIAQTESGQDISLKIKTGFNSAIPIDTFLAKRSQIGEIGQNVAVNTTPPSDNPAQRLTKPESPADFVVAGLVQTDKGNSSAAITSYTAAITRDPNSPEAYYHRGNLRHSQGDISGAIEDYTQAINLNPNYSNAYYNRGCARFFDLKDYAGAIADYTEAIRLNPNDALAYYNRAAARSKLHDREGTVADFTAAISIKPNYIRAYIERGRFRNSLGDRQGAIADFTSAIELTSSQQPNQAIAYYNRGLVRRNIKDLPGALADLQTAAQLFQQQGETRYYQKATDEVYWLNREIDRHPSAPQPQPNNNGEIGPI
jgi:tetratricopeptide (TPR) repeat protein